jgi:hypothetical protein
MARNTPAIQVLMLSMVCLGVREAASAVIPVTTVEQKISATGGCSLQEAIYSANFDSNVAIAGYTGSTPRLVTTQCVPGNGDDIIVLPAGATLALSKIVDDAINPTGPTATPIITSNITILAYGATLERVGSRNFRLFTVGATGRLTIRRAYIRGFRAKGGDAYYYGGGGGGLGAGGAIFNMGVLIVDASTFEANIAAGGVGSVGLGGGGAGIGGNGGPPCDEDTVLTAPTRGGTGGGGARGNGAPCLGVAGGGGGGTLKDGYFGLPGFDCGGAGGGANESGDAGRCPGGGGGGGADNGALFIGYDGGHGHYGGGGGGGGLHGGGDGGRGGFGGGGGASGIALAFGVDGGNGGFGGGGGAGNNGGITDGDAGNGGFFAGDGSSTHGGGAGGGGAGLGGAIFNDSGTVDIRNSTFTGNYVNGGFSDKSQDGSGGGGAIFSRNGHLTVLNSTITRNFGNFGGGIIVAQVLEGGIFDFEVPPTSFVLENTIVAGNGQYECAITGISIGVAFAGNLIMNNADGSKFDGKTFIGCGGVVSSSDPQLGPLAYNQGATPTMAIGATSPAWNAADPGSSLSVDQRKQERPAMGGFDIGAFELCLKGFGKLQSPCLILAGIENPGGGNDAVQLTVEVNPPGAGTTTPAPGTQDVALNSVVPLTEAPAAGFRFTNWSSNVTNPGAPSTTVVMNASQTVTANFALCECARDVTGAIFITYGGVTLNPMTKRYVQTLTLRNDSVATIAGPISLVLDKLSPNVTLYNASGTTALVLPAGSPYINATTSLAAGQSVTLQLQFTNPGNIVFSYDARVLAGPGSR